ncbi:MAG TPA: TOMM precursor leader peptide-binding protein [Blastocatellia bacterium]|nr:TOMM precursor leader peptide-binding protein [Blastocatellia bacterium]
MGTNQDLGNPSSIRPKLRQDSIFLPTDEGVLFKNHTTEFVIKGTSVYRWVAALVPLLNGENTLENICSQLDSAQCGMVTRIVRVLLEKGIVINRALDAIILPDAIHKRFADQIEYIAHYAGERVGGFAAFRNTRLLIVGSGISFISLAGCLLRNGLERLFLCPTEHSADVLEPISREICSLRESGVDASLSLLEYSKCVPESLSEFEMVVYCADWPRLRELELLNSQCRRAGVAFLPGLIFRQLTIAGPLVRPATPGCWLCGMTRMFSYSAGDYGQSFWTEFSLASEFLKPSCHFSVPPAKALGNSIAFEIFKFFGAYSAAETDGALLVVNTETLEPTRIPVVPYPLCPCCSSNDPQLERRRLQETVGGLIDFDISVEDRLKGVKSIVEQHYRITVNVNGADHLAHTSAAYTNGPISAANSPSAEGVNPSAEIPAILQWAVLQDAIGRYVSGLPDKRSMLSGSFNELCEDGLRPVAPQRISTWTGGPTVDETCRTEWLPAYSAFDRCFCYVPAAAVYPLSQLNWAGVFQKSSAGCVVATTFERARVQGMFSVLSHERVLDLIRGRCSAFRIEAERLAFADEQVGSMILRFQALGMDLSILALSHNTLVPVVAAVGGDGRSQRVGIGGSLDLVDAARHALSRLLIAAGNDHGGESLESFLGDCNSECVEPANDDFYERRGATIEDIDRWLLMESREIIYVNMTPSDIWQTRALVSGRVLLTAANQ